MGRCRFVGVVFAWGVWLALMPAAAWAQTGTIGIAGTARDTSGAVLPGVTVEAASPALIEKVRVVVTDAQGNYKITELRPGTYIVTFTLPGFSTFKRDGIELTAGFIATANAEMKVGGLEETITVTGASPVVDIQNVRTQNVLSTEVLDTLPSGRGMQAFATLTVGASTWGFGRVDVGGNQNDAPNSIVIHGSRGLDTHQLDDGFNYQVTFGFAGGFIRHFYRNQVGTQEQILETSAIGPEYETGGVQVNAVPKDGGNTFKFYTFDNYTNHSLQQKNLTDEIRARGVSQSPSVRKIYDYGVGLGGPFVKDRLWFYSANRWWGAQENQPNAYFNLNQGVYVGAPNSGVSLYEPDFSRPAYTDRPAWDYGVRLTWQATAKHKITFHNNYQLGCNCVSNTSANFAIEASLAQQYGSRTGPGQGREGLLGRGRLKRGWSSRSTWTYPATNRLLVSAGAAFGFFGEDNIPVGENYTGPGKAVNAAVDIGINDLGKGIIYNAGYKTGPSASATYGQNLTNNFNGRAAVAYVTGSHAFKVGMTYMLGLPALDAKTQLAALTQTNYTFRNGVPISLNQLISPWSQRTSMGSFGYYGQDQWKIQRLTLNLGLRFDHITAASLETHWDATKFSGPYDFPEVKNLPNWKDVTPRLGAAYDLFGNGKTAVKASLGKYVAGLGSQLAQNASPTQALSIITSRTWTDTNGNYVPDCELTSSAANGECGAFSNRAFGTSVVTTTLDPGYLNGWNKRWYDWQGSVNLQHELRPGFGVNVGYFRTWYGNFSITENRAVTAADFDTYCVTQPTDARLPGGGGKQVCGYYDINPAKFGLINNVSTLDAGQFGGKQTEVFNGVDVSFSSRFGDKGTMLAGGVSTGKTTEDTCNQNAFPQVNDERFSIGTPYASLPRNQQFCHVSTPWASQTQIKLNGVYPLPGDFQVSGTFQNLGGPTAASLSNVALNNPTVLYTSAQIAPSLGRNLAAGPNATVNLAVLPTQTLFEKRITQLDLRLTKIIRVGKTRLQGMFDVYNVFNTAAIILVNTQYGAPWLSPTAIQGARLFKFGAQVDW